MGEEKDKMSQNKVSISDTDNNDDDTGKTHSNMSDVEKSRKATEFQSITEADRPPEDTNENMDDDVFSNNESTKQQKDQGDKKTVPNSSSLPSPPCEKTKRTPKKM